MKKALIFILAIAMLLTMAACGKSDSKNDSADDAVTEDNTQPSEKPEDNTAEPDAPVVDDAPAADPNETPAEPDMPAVDDEPAVEPDNNDTPAVDAPATGDTLGNTLKADFIARAEADASLSAEELANAVISNPIIQFGPATMPVEPGFLMGFDNAEITGFSEGVMFAPMIGSIPFVGYVFTLEDGADVQAFLDTLNANANPRWNICVEAEETVSCSVGNKVFFVMCPTSVEG